MLRPDNIKFNATCLNSDAADFVHSILNDNLSKDVVESIAPIQLLSGGKPMLNLTLIALINWLWSGRVCLRLFKFWLFEVDNDDEDADVFVVVIFLLLLEFVLSIF